MMITTIKNNMWRLKEKIKNLYYTYKIRTAQREYLIQARLRGTPFCVGGTKGWKEYCFYSSKINRWIV